MEEWPSTLPQEFDMKSLSISTPDALMMSQTESGLPKRRKRFTKNLTIIKGRMEMFHNEIQILRDFIALDLNGGVQTFAFPRPGYLEGVMPVFFRKYPSFSHLGANVWSVEIELGTIEDFWVGGGWFVEPWFGEAGWFQ